MGTEPFDRAVGAIATEAVECDPVGQWPVDVERANPLDQRQERINLPDPAADVRECLAGVALAVTGSVDAP